MCKEISNKIDATYFINRNNFFQKLNKKNKNFLLKNYFQIGAPLNFIKNIKKKYIKKKKFFIKGASKAKNGYKIDVNPYHYNFSGNKKDRNLKKIFQLFKTQYKVNWEKNMILIWNNNVVFHKASKANGDRLIYRIIIDEKKK